MSSKDYSEDLFKAMEQLINAKMSNMKFDQTIVCTIVDNSNVAEGYYQVTDGAVTFDAYSENSEYDIDDQVYVLIPQGNWESRKQITALYSTSQKTVSYIPKFDKLVKIQQLDTGASTADKFQQGYDVDTSSEMCISARGAFCVLNTFNGADESSNLTPFNTNYTNSLCIRFKLQTEKINEEINFDDFDFGLQITVSSVASDDDLRPENSLILPFYTKKDMFGDPCQCLAATQQEIVYLLDPTALPLIGTVVVELIREDLSTADEDPALNISITDLEVYLCHDISKYENNTVLIFPEHSDGSYLWEDVEDEDVNQQSIGLIWVNKDSEGRYIGFNDAALIAEPNVKKAINKSDEESLENKYYWIDWHRDTNEKKLKLDNQRETIFAPGEDTNQIDFLNYKYQLSVLQHFITTEIQATVWINGDAHQSNILTLKNSQPGDKPEETLGRINSGIAFGVDDDRIDRLGGHEGHTLFYAYPLFTYGENIDQAIKFNSTKKINIISCEQMNSMDRIEELQFTYKVEYEYPESGNENGWSENTLKYGDLDANFNVYVEEETNLLRVEIMVANDWIADIRNEADSGGTAATGQEKASFSFISSIGFTSENLTNDSTNGSYILNEENLMNRLMQAEDKIKELANRIAVTY